MVEPAHEHVDPAHTHSDVGPAVSRPGLNWGGLAIRVILTLIGAAGLIISAFMDWVRGVAAVDINVRGLWQTRFDTNSSSFIATIGFVVIVLGLVAIVGMAPRSGWLTSLAGALGIAVFVLFLIQLYRADLAVSDVDAGAWVALAGGVVALIGGFFGTRTAVVAAGPTVVEP